MSGTRTFQWHTFRGEGQQGLAANMAKTIGQPAPKRYVPESDTYYLEYAMNEGAGNLSLGFKLPDEEK